LQKKNEKRGGVKSSRKRSLFESKPKCQIPEKKDIHEREKKNRLSQTKKGNGPLEGWENQEEKMNEKRYKMWTNKKGDYG